MTQDWEKWFRKWRGSDLASLVVEAARLLLERGQFTADDLRCVKLRGDPRIRGAAVRAVEALGLGEVANERAKPSISDKCHHRPIETIVLKSADNCRDLLRAHESSTLGQYANEPQPTANTQSVMNL